jgi:uncharacterized membrane protein YkvA (DUF1232 family)
MPEFLKLLSVVQVVSSWQSLVRAAWYLFVAVLLYNLWWAEHPLARLIGFAIADVVLFYVMIAFLRAPVEYAQYLALKALFLLLGVVRLTSKAFLMCLAFLLSAIYFMSPIDIIPDLLLGIGWIDDLLLAIGLISWSMSAKVRFPVPDPGRLELENRPGSTWITAAALSTVLTCVARGLTG